MIALLHSAVRPPLTLRLCFLPGFPAGSLRGGFTTSRAATGHNGIAANFNPPTP